MTTTLITGAVAILSLVLAAWLAGRLIKQKIADEGARLISGYIKEGAMAFLWKEYKILAIVVMVLVLVMLLVPAWSWKMAVTFLVGAILSALAGFVSVWLSTAASAQVAERCQEDANAGLRLSFLASSITGLAIVGLGLLGVAVFYLVFDEAQIIFGFGLGVSLVALFIRVGGGIYTKAADIGADWVGKIEEKIPEDDLRNPAVIADVVGDNVGDMAGMGADLFESYVDGLIAALALTLAFLPLFGVNSVALPLLLAAIGLATSIAGGLVVMMFKGDTAGLIRKGNWLAAILMIIISFFAVRYTVGDINIFWSLVIGLAASWLITGLTKYFLSEKRWLVKSIANASGTGAATNIIYGLSWGMISSIISAAVVVAAVSWSYKLGDLFGLAIASWGMLSNLAIILASNTFGPIVDNAAGISRMAGLGHQAQAGSEKLDEKGNIGATLNKNVAIVSAVLTAIVLLVSFSQMVNLETVNLLNIKVLLSLLVGAILPFLFCALTVKSVGQAAAKMVEESRRQFREISGLLSGETQPDYKRCIKISTNAALRQMILPGILAVAAPLVIGWWWGAESLVGLLVGSLVVGFLLATWMVNAGGLWDNAKKFLANHDLNQPNGEAYKAAIIGDTVGDPLKDVAGPALNIFIKLMIIVAIIMAPLMMK
jgi:K(+)-stimulated pyrophosphate-energized sodium pump